MTIADIICDQFAFLQSHYRYVLQERIDDPRVSYVIFRRRDICVTVYHEDYSKESGVYFQHDVPKGHKIGLGMILDREGAESGYEIGPATGQAQIRIQMNALASLCQQYAVRAIEGDIGYFDEISKYNANRPEQDRYNLH